MTSVRRWLPAIAVVVALLGSTSLSTFVAAAHPLCTVKQHDCGQQPTIKRCCCGEQNTSEQGTPISANVTVIGTPLPVATPFANSLAPGVAHALVRTQASAPRAAPVDFPTLFATLLI